MELDSSKLANIMDEMGSEKKSEAEKKQDRANIMMSKLESDENNELMNSFEIASPAKEELELSAEPIIIDEPSKEKNFVGDEPSQPNVLIQEKPKKDEPQQVEEVKQPQADPKPMPKTMEKTDSALAREFAAEEQKKQAKDQFLANP